MQRRTRMLNLHSLGAVLHECIAHAHVGTRGNKLRKSEYDEATWSTRTWTTFAAQRIACTLTLAVATDGRGGGRSCPFVAADGV